MSPKNNRVSSLEGKVTLVTGAGGNLGRATVVACRSAGARLVLVDRDRKSLEDRLRELNLGKDEALLLTTDLSDASATRATFDEARARWGRLDAVFHLAGGFLGVAPLHETSDDDYRSVLDLNLHPAFSVARAALPAMIEQKSGVLVFIAARAGLRAPGGLAAYSAAKSGVLRLTESLAEDLRGTGVRVNSLLPAAIAPAGSTGGEGTPADAIADVLVFLATDAARAVHGALIEV
jgi:NAD(P)-dependent dehydrogenase (short-subunit alcohol dehydrogenase family)